MARYEQCSINELTLQGDIRRVDPRRSTITIEGNELTQAWYEQSAAQLYPLGTRLLHNDGRVFRYASASGALVAGNLLQSAANGGTTTLQKDLVVATSSAVGAYTGYATISVDTIAANLFTDGYYIVSVGTAAQGRGQIYQIKSHPVSAAASIAFTFYEPVRVAITAGAAQVALTTNLYKAVIQAPITTPTGVIVGVAPIAVTTAYYFWTQTWGIANVLVQTATTAGTAVMRDVAAAGSVGVQAAGATSLATEVVGYAPSVTDTTDNGFVFLTIAP